MRHRYCDRCYRKQDCTKLCNRAEQIVSGRKKKEIDIVYEHQLTGEDRIKYFKRIEWKNKVRKLNDNKGLEEQNNEAIPKEKGR